MSIYVPEIVQKIQEFYGPLLDITQFEGKIASHLNQLAKRLNVGIQSGHQGALTEVNNYHPGFLGLPISELKEKELSFAEAQQTIASEFGFKDWQAVLKLDLDYDTRFEQAVFQLLEGDLSGLRKHVSVFPELVKARSAYGHRATLLHYTGSNGIEIWRQKVPENLPDITRFLIDSGADKNATMVVYGGAYTPYFLALSSAHPYDAGIADGLLSALS